MMQYMSNTTRVQVMSNDSSNQQKHVAGHVPMTPGTMSDTISFITGAALQIQADLVEVASFLRSPQDQWVEDRNSINIFFKIVCVV